ncbi:histone H1C-like, partial [Camellia sinensis]|uniref:histone H1C-like n=1 Tax=Camellia sinensis TaxID=4442 RepID=UPI0010364F6B
MGRAKPVAKDLLADIPSSIDEQPTQIQPPEKPKKIKKAQPKAKVAQPRSSATTSGSKKPAVPWAPEITLEDKPVMASDSADDINVSVALSTALLLPGDLERNAKYSEYENYALMLQHSVQAIQHAHSFSIQSFENRQKLANMKKEFSSIQKVNKGLESKMKKLEDQAEAAIKAQNIAEEKAEDVEAIKKKDDAIPLPFPPAPTPSEDIGESDAEDEAKEEEDN